MPAELDSRCLARPVVRCITALLTLASVLPSTSAGAQKLQFRQLTPDDGLVSSQVSAIHQDSRGFMWMGSPRGLSRYDGYSFVTYRHRADDPTSLGDNHVHAMHEDRDKTLWIATNQGLSRYDAARDAFTNYRIAAGETLGVNRMLSTGTTLLVATNRGLYSLDRTTGKASRYGSASFASSTIRALYEDRSGHIWVGTELEGAFEFDPVRGSTRAWAPDPDDPTSFPAAHANGFHEDSSGAMWITSYGAGLIRLDRTTAVATQYSIDPRDPLFAASKWILNSMAEGRRGLWLGTENGGLDYFDFATKQFHHNRFDANNPSSISSNSLWALHRDRTGLIWAGTFAGGVNISAPNSSAIHRYRSVPGDLTSLSFNSVKAFKEDSKGRMWVATDGGGLNRFDRATGRFVRYTSATSNLNSDAVLAIAEDPAGMLWIGTWAGGLSRFDPGSGRFTPFPKADSRSGVNSVFSLLFDRAGILWIGTFSEGLRRYDAKTGILTTYPLATMETGVHVILEASDGNLLLATENSGFFIFDPRTGRKTVYQAGRNSISSNQVTSLLESEPGVIWIGTIAGLDRLDRRTNTFQHFTDADGLASPIVSGLAMDAARKLWVSGDRGITRFDPAAKTGEHYAVADGLQGSEFNARASYEARDGTLFFGGTQGFNTIRPDGIVRNTRAPHVALTGFELFNKPVAIGGVDSPLQSSITVAEQLVLRHGQSAFSIEFAALDFTAPEKNQYAYRLEGLDDDWNDVGTKRSASYTHLGAGSYVFRVKAMNNDGVWNNEGASIRVEILPPFWATWWFRTLALSLVAAAAYALLRARHTRRTEFARAAKIRASNEERQRLAASIRHLLDASGEGIYGLDVRGDITFVNRRGSEMLGFEPEELVGHSMHDLTHHSRRDGTPYPRAESPIERAARDGVPCEVGDEVLWRKDGTPIQVEYAAAPVLDDGTLSGAVVNFRDITARRRVELELILARDAAEAASRAKSDFLARMSHELRTPLNSIIGFANVLLRNKRQALKDEELTYLDRISGSGRHLLGLINDILDLSKIEAGRMTLEISSVMLDTLVRETVEQFESQTKDTAVTLRTEIPRTIRSLETDAVRMKQVLINLIGNALKFTEKGEIVVSIDVDRDGRPNCLTVRDTGIGIPADRLAAIFKVFEQADSTTARRFGGTGLGLAISRSLCELMGHSLDVDSVEGAGTTMSVRLGSPVGEWQLSTPMGTPVTRSDRSASALGAPYVLVVDDDPDARLLLGQLLEEEGCHVLHAGTAVDALRLARDQLPAMIFLDLHLPSISGFDLFRIFQTDDALKSTPIVIVSVTGTDSRSALPGAAAILDKPVTREQIHDLVDSWLHAAAHR